MKKTILFLFLLAGSATYAQSVTAGIKAGANISNFSGGDFDAVKCLMKNFLTMMKW